MGPSSNRKLITIVGAIAFLLLLAVNIILVIQNRELKQRLQEIVERKAPEVLKVGDKVPSVVITMLDGQKKELAFTNVNKKYLLFLFNTVCGSCERNFPYWETIATAKQNGTYDIFGLSVFDIEKTHTFVVEKKVRLPVGLADTNFVRTYRVRGVPHTVLIDGSGVVQKIWSGTLKPEDIEEIMKMLSAS